MAFDPYKVVRDFEAALCEYTGAKYAVTTTSCTMALLLAVAWHLRDDPNSIKSMLREQSVDQSERYLSKWKPKIEIPKRTYISVPMAIIHSGGMPTFRDENWSGQYQLRPLPVWDSARWFTKGMYECETLSHAKQMLCVSFHWTKILAIGQGGAILHDNDEADEWLRRARFDGRKEGVAPKDDVFPFVGWHCYMSPRDAAEGLSRLAVLPEYNSPLPNSDYPDLSKLEIFK